MNTLKFLALLAALITITPAHIMAPGSTDDGESEYSDSDTDGPKHDKKTARPQRRNAIAGITAQCAPVGSEGYVAPLVGLNPTDLPSISTAAATVVAYYSPKASHLRAEAFSSLTSVRSERCANKYCKTQLLSFEIGWCKRCEDRCAVNLCIVDECLESLAENSVGCAMHADALLCASE